MWKTFKKIFKKVIDKTIKVCYNIVKVEERWNILWKKKNL